MADCWEEDGAGHSSGSLRNGLFLNETCVLTVAGTTSRGALRRVWMMISGWQNSLMGKREVPTPRDV